MKFFTRFFSQAEVVSNENNPGTIRENVGNKNMELIKDKNFDLNAFLGDFDAKINFLYEKISKMEVKMQKKDQELQKVKEMLNMSQVRNNKETSIDNSKKNNLKDKERVCSYNYYYKNLIFYKIVNIYICL